MWTRSTTADGSAHILYHPQSELHAILYNTSSTTTVHTQISVPTEDHTHQGTPHTLEHLIFLGSHQYPYKGILDTLANTYYSNGTNAYTATDHTAYTISNIATHNTLLLLPVYLDHILFPTITQHAYNTEVHHIDSQGNDAGVVYCEMQAIENTEFAKAFDALVQTVYPGSPYSMETGGKLKWIRDGLDVHKVREFHKKFYRPQNMCIIITGNVKPQEFIDAIEPYMPKIMERHDMCKDYQRPWQDPVPLFNQSVQKTIEFPSDDESFGSLIIGWRCFPWKEFEKRDALEILLRYLTDSPIAPLQKALVEVEDPSCGRIQVEGLKFRETAYLIVLESVPVEKLNFDVVSEVFNVLLDIKRGEIELDLSRIHSLIRKEKREVLDALETEPENYVFELISQQFLYGDNMNPEQISRLFAKVDRLNALEKEPIEYWLDLLITSLIENPHADVIAKPSKDLHELSLKQEEERILAQRSKLGEAGLKERGEILEASKRFNEIPIPKELLESFPPSKLDFENIPVKSYRNVEARRRLKNDQPNVSIDDQNVLELENLPISLQVSQVDTQFANIGVVINTASLPDDLRPFLAIYSELMFECSIEENGVVIDADEVIELLEDDTVSYSANFGIGGQFKQGLYIKVKVLAEDYAKGVNWIFRFLWNLEFDAEKIQILINKKLGDIVSDKRDGNTVCKATSSLRLFNSSHNSHANNLLVQASFLESLESRLETDPNSILGDLYRLRDLLGRTNCCQFLLILDPARVADLADPWIQKQWPETNSVAEPLPLCSEYLLPRPAHGEVVQIGGVESGYLMFTSQALPTISRLEDEMCLRLYLEYLTMLEGPLWVQIRGSGLAYSYGMNYNVSDRTLRESLYRATDLPAAYSALERALIPSGSLPSLSSARSSLIFSLISSCSTPVLAAEECFRCASLLGFPEDHYRVTAVSLVLSLDASSVWRMSSIVLDALNRSDRVAVSGAISTELAHLCNISPEIE